MKIGWQPFEAIVFDPEQVTESPWMRSSMGHVVAVFVDGSPLGDEGLTLIAGLDEPAAMRLPGKSSAGDWLNGGLDLDNQRADAIARVIALDGIYVRHGHGQPPNIRPNPWASSTGGIAQLIDGRFISWFSFIDVTGSGFHPDAYGGDTASAWPGACRTPPPATVVYVSATFRGVWMALSEAERGELVYATSPEEEAPTDVLHDRFLELGGGDEPDLDLVSSASSLDEVTSKDLVTITYRRHVLIALAHEMGVFDGCEAPRIDELLRQWNGRYARLRFETALATETVSADRQSAE